MPSEWSQWIASHDALDSVSAMIHQLRAMEELGAEVMVARADVANLAQMHDVVEAATQRFGELHGVIHSAGIAGGGMIQLKQASGASAVLNPKVHGTLVLDAIFKAKPLDFMVLCSSLTSVLGGFGQLDYCAANAFMDAYANGHPTAAAFTVCINWDTWKEVGMAVKTVLPADLSEHRAEQLRDGARCSGPPARRWS